MPQNSENMVDTLQAILYGIFHGFSSILPISTSAHHWAISYLYDIPLPSDALLGVMNLGAFCALLFYFRYDWMSMLSSFLQVALFWKKPMTLDERMPFFILITCVPGILFWIYARPMMEQIEITPMLVGGSLILFCIPLGLAERMNRQQKTVLSWNWLDSLIVGISQCLFFFPGGGRQIGVLTAGMFRNYQKEAAAKFAFYTLAPVLGFLAVWQLHAIDFKASQPESNLSWLSFSMAGVLSFACSLLAVGGFMKSFHRSGSKGYISYRIVLAAGIFLIFFLKD